ncbi:MAG: hypothetical protein Q8Q59_12720 [Luteolibacter sp.]|jgi:hypothetical protein|nr:hypothetical protein [Luteolibacter sp.]
MNSLLESFLKHGLLLDAAGVIGLGLLGLAAVKLARRDQSWGGTMMASGAIALLVARLYMILSPHFVNDEILHRIGPIGISLTYGLPPLLLSLGLAGIVWGLWGHERWLKENG